MQKEEYIKFKKNKKEFSFEAKLRLLTLKEEDMFIFYVPSLSLSYYGETLKEAQEGLEFTLESYLENLRTLPKSKIDTELYQLGWHKKESFSNKEYSHSSIDVNGVLKNFNLGHQNVLNDQLMAV